MCAQSCPQGIVCLFSRPDSSDSNRLAHRIRDMQTLPYVVVKNSHIGQVYELYYSAFETLRKVKEIKTLEDNEAFCKIVSNTLQQHLPVIPKLAMGILECRDLMKSEGMDKFMTTILRSVIVYICLEVQALIVLSVYHEESLRSSTWLSLRPSIPLGTSQTRKHQLIWNLLARSSSNAMQRKSLNVAAKK